MQNPKANENCVRFYVKTAAKPSYARTLLSMQYIPDFIAHQSEKEDFIKEKFTFFF